MTVKKGKDFNKKKPSGTKKPAAVGKKAPEAKPVEIFYYGMLRKEATAMEIAELSGLPREKKEVWVETNICELMLEKDALVFEDAGEDFTMQEDQEFLKEQDVKEVYAISFMDVDQEKAMGIITRVMEVFDGVLCSDTEDFEPVIFGSFKEA